MRSLVRAALEKMAELRLRQLCECAIGTNVKVNFRSIVKRPPAKLFIGDGSIFEGMISADRQSAIVSIGQNTFVGGAHLVCAKEIRIGNDVLISWGCTLVDHNSHSTVWSDRKDDVRKWHEGKKDWTRVAIEAITIHDKAWIGFNSIILKGVTIGEGAIVGAGSVVTKDVEPYTVVVGNPARVVKDVRYAD